MDFITLSHVLISLVGIATGLVALAAMLRSQLLRGWTAAFLATTVLTSLTGFLFPFPKLLPSHIIALMSLVLLAVACFALYARQLAGFWRTTYVVTAALSLYFNVFVLIIQSFMKVPALKALAPTQTEPAFVIVQGATLLLFVALTIFAAIRFRPLNLATIAS